MNSAGHPLDRRMISIKRERDMTEAQAKKHLTKMLNHFTAGSILHLLSDVIADDAEQARSADDARRFNQLKLVEHTLTVVGMGVDSACPS